MFTPAPTSACPQDYEKQGKWVSSTPDNELNNGDAEGWRLDLRTAPILVLRLDVLGDTLGGTGLVLTPFLFGPHVLQGGLESPQADIRLRSTS